MNLNFQPETLNKDDLTSSPSELACTWSAWKVSSRSMHHEHLDIILIEPNIRCVDQLNDLLFQMEKDKGYSWVVLFAASMLNVHQGGGVGSVGVFLVEFMDHFDAPKSATTLIAALLLCTGFLFGEFTSALYFMFDNDISLNLEDI